MSASETDISQGYLFVDHYELTMIQLYFRAGIHEIPAQFDHFFRKYPDYGAHQAGYCINAGMESLVGWMRETHIRPREIEQLRTLRDRAGGSVFKDDFLEWLSANGHFQALDVKAIPEGRVVHPNEPLTVVRGPLAMAQMLESVLLNRLNYQTLIATKAARIRAAGRGNLLVDFGMRRAQDLGANAATRAALIGGADFTSNTGISLALGYPPKGTHAHSMVQAFMALGASEIEAFEQYAALYPDNCILLVDTVDTLRSGVPNAIKVFEKLKRKGHQPIGVRLDSGDLAHLAVQTSAMLDEAGFSDCKIMLSNQLDEQVIQQIIVQIVDEADRSGADPDKIVKRLAYGVGTQLVTSAGSPALDGVYKLVGIKRNDEWQPAIKLSENIAKIPNPGEKTIWRLYDHRGMATADLIGRGDEKPYEEDPLELRHPLSSSARRSLPRAKISDMEELLTPVLSEGRLVCDLPDIETIRKVRDNDLQRLHTGVKRIINPHVYHVSLSGSLWDLKQDMVMGVKPR